MVVACADPKAKAISPANVENVPQIAKSRRRRRRETETVFVEGCAVEQIRGRHPEQPAYRLSAFAFDSESTPKMEYCSKWIISCLF